MITPEEVKVFPEFTFQFWLADRVSAFPMDIFTVDDVISRPPSVSVPAPVMPMSDKAPPTLRLPHDVALPNVRLVPSEVPAQAATSPEPGAVPPFQLAPAVRSVPVPSFVIVPACVPVAKARHRKTRAARLNRSELEVWFFIVIIV